MLSLRQALILATLWGASGTVIYSGMTVGDLDSAARYFGGAASAALTFVMLAAGWIRSSSESETHASVASYLRTHVVWASERWGRTVTFLGVAGSIGLAAWWFGPASTHNVYVACDPQAQVVHVLERKNDKPARVWLCGESIRVWAPLQSVDGAMERIVCSTRSATARGAVSLSVESGSGSPTRRMCVSPKFDSSSAGYTWACTEAQKNQQGHVGGFHPGSSRHCPQWLHADNDHLCDYCRVVDRPDGHRLLCTFGTTEGLSPKRSLMSATAIDPGYPESCDWQETDKAVPVFRRITGNNREFRQLTYVTESELKEARQPAN